jgi:hypothetical protein
MDGGTEIKFGLGNTSEDVDYCLKVLEHFIPKKVAYG